MQPPLISRIDVPILSGRPPYLVVVDNSTPVNPGEYMCRLEQPRLAFGVEPIATSTVMAVDVARPVIAMDFSGVTLMVSHPTLWLNSR
ncbi:hypothetical protein BVC80_7903g3 [Macleaya cordata]|uniref:Uncharacterized protein n=1 Tax=Macleaya cordata TaxID=56857 RepID=A0A200PTJ9_MACCD|nr:hypothetical protein BVC80_7903g3 [Macleaya cordata]